MTRGLGILPLGEAKRLYSPSQWVPEALRDEVYTAAGQFIIDSPAEGFPQLGRIAVVIEMEGGTTAYHPFVMGTLRDEKPSANRFARKQ